MFSSLLLALVLFQSDSLENFEQQAKTISQLKDWSSAQVQKEALSEKILDYIDAGSVASGSDMRRLSNAYSRVAVEFEKTRVVYELALAARAQGEVSHEGQIAAEWDNLMFTMGRRQRLGTMKVPGSSAFASSLKPEWAEKAVSRVLLSPSAARVRSARYKDSALIKRIVDADQADRNVDWMKLSVAQLEQISRRDRRRFADIKRLVSRGALRTANDYFNAALVFQHGSYFDEFRSAHELAVAGMLLGSKEAIWLCAASYDRMLMSAGFRQRFDTQYDARGLKPYDVRGICDAERKAMNCPTLEEAKKRTP